MQVETLGILGAGTMGTGIAQVAAQAGIRAVLVESSEAAIPRSRQRLERSLQEGIKREKLTPEQAEAVRGLISWETDDACLVEADWILEAVFEDREAKRGVLARVTGTVSDGVPIATNTSTLRIGDLAQLCRRPERFLGMHFFNPPPAMKLVEVVPGEKTRPEVTAWAVALCERMGKTPKLAPDIPGFVVNRAYAALFAAAAEICDQGAEPEAIDASLELGLGHKMGPLKTADLVGLDVMLALMRLLHEQTGHARFEAPRRLAELVEAGKLGRKSGEGFYRYDG